MPTRNTPPKRHDTIIEWLFNGLCAKGYDGSLASQKALPEDIKPDKIYNDMSKYFYSDLTAKRDGVLYLSGVETDDSLDFIRTKPEIECFVRHV
jgi:hypothetical protein